MIDLSKLGLNPTGITALPAKGAPVQITPEIIAMAGGNKAKPKPAPALAAPAAIAPPKNPAAAPAANSGIGSAPQMPPGLPQSFIDIDIQEQMIPMADVMEMAEDKKHPVTYRATAGPPTLCYATSIPFSPCSEPRVVTERIAQGPHVFVGGVTTPKREQDEPEKAPEAQGPTLAHPDTLLPGRHIKGDSVVYRPGA